MDKQHLRKLATRNSTDKHMTPARLTDFAKLLMGVDQFDTDPASEPDNPTGAKVFYTEEDDGLLPDNPWTGNVWLNPPFSKNKHFTKKLLAELANRNITQCVMLNKSESRTAWSRDIWSSAHWVFPYLGGVAFEGSENIAFFSVFLYGWNLKEYNVRKALQSELGSQFAYLENHN